MSGQRWFGTIAAAGLVALLAGCGGGSSAAHPSAPVLDLARLHGTKPANQTGRPQFTLTDTSGRPYNFDAHTQGHVTLLYAGYTHCPDECPTTMAAIAVALRSLPSTLADQVRVVFISVDPHRDTAQVIRKWLNRFHPPLPYVGLRGTPVHLARVELSLGMPVAKRLPASADKGSGAYAVQHFDGLLTYGKDDRLETIYASTIKPSTLAKDLRLLLAA